MSLENQISLMNNPQEFTRLYNAALKAEHGDDFLEIDDDQSDGGNDGYLKSKKRMFAGHCFKRLQNQSIEREIRAKISSDFAKAVRRKESGEWAVEGWTFISNYPIADHLAQEFVEMGRREGIDVGWRHSNYLARMLTDHPGVRAQFPQLETNEIMQQLAELRGVQARSSVVDWDALSIYEAPTFQETSDLITQKPLYWEFTLFTAVLLRGRSALTRKLLDCEMGFASRSGSFLEPREAIGKLNAMMSDASRIIGTIDLIFAKNMQDRAFGLPGEPGDATRIAHLAERTIGCVEELLDWAAALRGLGVPNSMTLAFDKCARLVDQPIGEILEFVDSYGELLARIPDIVESAGDEHVSLSQPLTLTIDPIALAEFSEEFDKLSSNLLSDPDSNEDAWA